MEKTKKKFQMPDTYVIIVGLIIIMIVLTWIIPAGQFDLGENGKTVLAGTYHHVERNPAGLIDFLESFYLGMQKGSTTIFLVLMIGGAFGILLETGTVHAAIGTAIRKTQGNYKLIIPVLMVVMSILGALGCGINVALAFTSIMLILCKKLKLDKLAVVAALYLAANTGFSASPINPFTVLLGQSIAEIPTMSGAVPRMFMWVVFTTVAIVYTMRYCAKVTKDPSRALAPFAEGEFEDDDSGIDNVDKLTPRHILCLLILAGTFIVFGIGTVKAKWDLPALGTCMMAMAFLCGIAGGLNPNKMASAFVNGAKGMVYSAMMVGFASAINVIMTNANIIHSVIYYLSLPVQHLPHAISAVGMFCVNFIFNFFVPSGSGQCYIVMPLFAPMADLLGLTRQVAVSAFQFGDGLCNAVIPTTSLLVGTLGIAKVPFNKWERFAFPVTGLLACCAAIFLIVMTAIGWS